MDRDKIQGLLAILASLFVLFSSMIRPELSMVIAVASLVCLGAYNLIKKNDTTK